MRFSCGMPLLSLTLGASPFVRSIAQGGQLDPTFGVDGVVTIPQTGNELIALRVLGNGTILTLVDDGQFHRVIGYNSVGSIDTAFAVNGEIICDTVSGYGARLLERQGDGFLLVTGGSGLATIWAYDGQGEPDGYFDGADHVDLDIECGWTACSVPDGFLFAGIQCLVKYDLAGARDTSFGENALAEGSWICNRQFAEVVEVGPDRFVAVGVRYPCSPGDHHAFHMLYSADGELINGVEYAYYDPSIPWASECVAASAKPNGGFITVSNSDVGPGVPLVYYFDEAGQYEQSDDIFLGWVSMHVRDACVDQLGRVIAVGEGPWGLNLVRLNDQADEDGSFGPNGLADGGDLLAGRFVALQPDGAIIVLGDGYLARFNNDISTSTDELDPEAVLRLSPNPALDQLWIRPSAGMIGGAVQIVVMEMLGREVMSMSGPVPEQGTYTLDVASLRTGCYSVRMQFSDHSASALFVKQ
jgi:hypothetical protein